MIEHCIYMYKMEETVLTMVIGRGRRSETEWEGLQGLTHSSLVRQALCRLAHFMLRSSRVTSQEKGLEPSSIAQPKHCTPEVLDNQ